MSPDKECIVNIFQPDPQFHSVSIPGFLTLNTAWSYFAKKQKIKQKISRHLFTGSVQMPQGCRATMGRQFILLNIKSSKISDAHLTNHLFLNKN